MARLARLLLLLAPAAFFGACAVDGLQSQKEPPTQRMGILPAVANATPANGALPADDRASSQPAVAPPATATTNTVLGTFEAVARPVLARQCTPCHEPGGQMYGKLPFDKAAVVASHPAGVLKRLKGDDRRILADWLASNPPPTGAL